MSGIKDTLGDQPYSDLFAPRPDFDAKASRAAKEEGMARASTNADPAWKDAMLDCIRSVAKSQLHFTADDIFELAETRRIKHNPEKRAFGPVMVNAAKAGICKKADRMPVNSRRRTLHSSQITVWESLIFSQDQKS